MYTCYGGGEGVRRPEQPDSALFGGPAEPMKAEQACSLRELGFPRILSFDASLAEPFLAAWDLLGCGWLHERAFHSSAGQRRIPLLPRPTGRRRCGWHCLGLGDGVGLVRLLDLVLEVDLPFSSAQSLAVNSETGACG